MRTDIIADKYLKMFCIGKNNWVRKKQIKCTENGKHFLPLGLSCMHLTILEYLTSSVCVIIGDFRFECEYEINYENDFSILVCRLHIVTSHTCLIP